MYSVGGVYACEHIHVGAYDGGLVEVRGQLAGLISLLLSLVLGSKHRLSGVETSALTC